ncbi:zinc finger protein 85-like isoform X2 [Centruroides sculpturatus]|uniref:zinc finger protein 85-like isoform X2 n=2 Tax=Centruroides sculpturatus TaxID=218467 RepID=UPI000C6E8662|nr:zinc finger protein 85-like isoform X2 [Centruroides sculpturatus]
MASTGYKGKRIKMDCNSKIRQSGSVCSSIILSQENLLDTSNSTSCNKSFSSVPLLDMLAEVASATLKNDPSLNTNEKDRNIQKNALQKTSTRAQLRKTHHSEYLTLDQIRVLSDKMLLEMFSELISDEIRRNYSYKCFLMPEKCTESFSSFGNENKARLQMKGHLLTHIAELLAEANAPGKSHRLKFVAEPLHVRKKRLLEGNAKKRRQLKQERTMKRSRMNNVKDSIKTISGQNKSLQDTGKSRCNYNLSFRRDHCDSRRKRKNKIQSGQTDGGNDDNDDNDKLSDEDVSEMLNPMKKKLTKHDKSYTKLKSKISNDELNGILKDKKYSVCLQSNKKLNLQEIMPPSNKTVEETSKKRGKGQNNQHSQNDVSCDSGTQIENCEQFERQKSTRTHIKINTEASLQTNEVNISISDDSDLIKQKEEYIQKFKDEKNSKTYQVDTLEQPQHDHCYTTVLGKRRGIETLHYELSSSEDEDNANDTISANLKSESPIHLIISTPCFPFIFTPLLPNISQVLEVSSENVNDDNSKQMVKVSCAQDTEESSSSVIQKPKQTRIRRINRIIIAEELKSDSEEDSENIPSLVSDKISTIVEHKDSTDKEKQTTSDNSKNHNVEGTPEWEKKLALKCIRALRYKKKEDRGPLQCRICKDKKFTAQATLMYHYRSHAGIKPFTCAVCGATFTRQHSLNYHMLIHNNKSRFACSDCGRNFRHPSHYKEHLRRHTGETPYECSDCTLRFKTRNTFKRHLKTRHGKILTAQGIVNLTVEEFYKVRTTPRRRIQKSLHVRKKDQETQWPEIYTVNEDDDDDDDDDDEELNVNKTR